MYILNKQKLNSQKGSITVFVIIAILFLIVILTGVVLSAQAKVAAQNIEIQRIKQNYELNIDEIYNQKLNTQVYNY